MFKVELKSSLRLLVKVEPMAMESHPGIPRKSRQDPYLSTLFCTFVNFIVDICQVDPIFVNFYFECRVQGAEFVFWVHIRYRKVASIRLSRLVGHLRIFRLFMKGKFDLYILWLLAKRVQNWIIVRSTTRDFTVYKFNIPFFGAVLIARSRSWIFL